MHIYIYIYIYIYIIYSHPSIYVCLHLSIYLSIYAGRKWSITVCTYVNFLFSTYRAYLMWIFNNVRTQIHVHAHTHAKNACMNVCMFVCVCVCVYVYLGLYNVHEINILPRSILRKRNNYSFTQTLMDRLIDR